jgi:hypothetical protein
VLLFLFVVCRLRCGDAMWAIVNFGRDLLHIVQHMVGLSCKLWKFMMLCSLFTFKIAEVVQEEYCTAHVLFCTVILPTMERQC